MMMRGRPRNFGGHFDSRGNAGEAIAMLAPTHWRAAEYLRAGGISPLGPFLRFGVPALCEHHAALDSFINEELGLKIALARDTHRK